MDGEEFLIEADLHDFVLKHEQLLRLAQLLYYLGLLLNLLPHDLILSLAHFAVLTIVVLIV
jgi:hypothetical protein